ncbi:hypothetical protein LXA43DRAFT_1103692 [Ganoderma leucocontextum]|nr:hypothetical protein LXA43DRAFT_1103692 [Ganoderma leucocontextum]
MPSTRYLLLATLLVVFTALAVDAAPIPAAPEDVAIGVTEADWLSANNQRRDGQNPRLSVID